MQLTRESRCDQHKRSKELSKNRPGDPFYTSRRWRALRERILRRDPLCVRCLAVGRTEPANEVHHIVPRKQAEALRYDELNLEALCKSCHSRETRRESGQNAPVSK